MRELSKNMDVDRAIDAACLRLGYSSLQKEQEKAVKNFASVLNMTTSGKHSVYVMHNCVNHNE